MAKRNNNNLSGLSSVARSTGEFLYQWPLVYTFSCCIVLAQGLEFTHMNSVHFLSTSCGQTRYSVQRSMKMQRVIWPLKYWFRYSLLRCCCQHSVVKAWENEAKVLTKTWSDIWDIVWFSSYRSSGVVKGNEYPMVLIWLSMKKETGKRLLAWVIVRDQFEFRQNLGDISV